MHCNQLLAMSAPVRLFVSLPPGVREAELKPLFTPFGEVTDCRLAPPKAYASPDAVFARDFAHVSLRPKDEAALRKCISAYNGCKWKGGVLRCGLARQHYVERLAAERAGGGGGELAAEVGALGALPACLALGGSLQSVPQAWTTPPAQPAGAPQAEQQALPPLEPGTVLRLKPPKAPTPVEVRLGSGTKLTSFPEPGAAKGGQQGGAAWEALPTPPRSGYRFEAHLQRIAADLPPQLLAAVEERRARGRRLAEARQAQAQEAAGAPRGCRAAAGAWGQPCFLHALLLPHCITCNKHATGQHGAAFPTPSWQARLWHTTTQKGRRGRPATACSWTVTMMPPPQQRQQLRQLRLASAAWQPRPPAHPLLLGGRPGSRRAAGGRSRSSSASGGWQ